MKINKPLKPIALINMIPFIDIMLVIFIVLILAVVNSYYSKLQLSVPDVRAGVHVKQLPFTIYINQQGQYSVDQSGKQLSLGQLNQRLTHQHSIAVLANPKTPYQYIAQLIAIAQQNQIHEINLIVHSSHFR